MKKTIVFLITLFVVSSVCALEKANVLFDFKPELSECKNIVPNFSFENVEKNKIPSEWNVKILKGKGEIKITDDKKFTGNSSICFYSDDSDFYGELESNYFPIEENTTYYLNYAYLGENPLAIITWYNKNKEKISQIECKISETSEDWIVFSQVSITSEFLSPNNAHFASVKICTNGKDKIYYDNMIFQVAKTTLTAKIELSDIYYVKLFVENQKTEGSWILAKDSGALPAGTNEYNLNIQISTISNNYNIHTLSRKNIIGGLDEPDVIAVPKAELNKLEKEFFEQVILKSKTIKKDRPTLIIEDVLIEEDKKIEKRKEGVNENAYNIYIKDGLFYRNDKPVFLMAVEGIPEHGQFHTGKVLSLIGIDLVQMQGWQHADYYNGRGNEKISIVKDKDDKVNTIKIYWDPPTTATVLEGGYPSYPGLIQKHLLDFSIGKDKLFLEESLKDLLKYGIAADVTIFSNHNDHQHPLIKSYYPEFFPNWNKDFGYDVHNPISWRLKQNLFKTILKQTRKYPIFVYEIFNEVGQIDDCPASLDIFKKRMKAKYKDIELANKIWNKKFSDFDHLENPLEMFPNKQAMYQREVKDNFSNTFWCDFKIFNEENTRDCFKKVADYVKKIDPTAKISIQSHCSLHYDYRSSCFGVYPYYKAQVEDIYGAQNAIAFGKHKNSLNYEYIYEMMLRMLEMDIVSNAAEGKPILNSETDTFSTSAVQKKIYTTNSSSLLINISGEWDFVLDSNDIGEKEKWFSEGADKIVWEKIKVPGAWEEQLPKYKDYDGIAWYRKKFIASKDFANKTLYLVGHQLDDIANIYLNGELLYQTLAYNEKVGIDISEKIHFEKENIITVKINDTYQYGGIIRFIGIAENKELKESVATTTVFEDRITGEEQRSAFWSRVVHGQDGTVPMYWYVGSQSSATYGIFDFKYYEPDALMSIPKTKKEINSVAEIVLPKPRIKGRIALVYPFEYLRYRFTKEWKKNDANNDILDYYIPALFSHIPLDVLNNESLLEKDISAYKVIILPLNLLVLPGTIEKLENYVKQGGILILSYDSLGTDAKFYKLLKTPQFTGIELGEKYLKSQKVNFKISNIKETSSLKRNSDLTYGVKLDLKTAKSLAVTSDDIPSLTVNYYGKGKVYYFGCKFSPPIMKEIFTHIINIENIVPEVKVVLLDASQSDYLETHFLGKDGRYVLYAMNWGLPSEFLLQLSKLPKLKYKLRDIATGDLIKSPKGNDYWTDIEIAQGIPIDSKTFKTKIILIEDVTLRSLVLEKLSEDEEKFLKELFACNTDDAYKIKQIAEKYYEIKFNRR